MIHKQIQSIKDVVSTELLPYVRKPGRYIGGEVNQVVKDVSACDVRVGLCFPDIYEIGMSYLGMEILYSILNGINGVAAERVFAPWFDAEDVMRQKNIPLFTMESHAAVKDFDLIGFSLTNELCYTNLLNLLDLAGLEVRSENRAEDDPIVIVGGQAANCAEPLSAFADMFVLGEGEEAAVEIIKLYRTLIEHHTEDAVVITETNVPNRENLQSVFHLCMCLGFMRLTRTDRLRRRWRGCGRCLKMRSCGILKMPRSRKSRLCRLCRRCMSG